MAADWEIILDQSLYFHYDKKRNRKGAVPDMTSPFRILEILTCSLAMFLPFVMLMTYPFRNNLRATGFLTSLAAVLQMVYNLALGLGIIKDTPTVPLIMLGIHMLLGLVLIRASAGKKLFTILTTVNSAIALSLAAKYLEGLLFPGQTLLYHWTYLVPLLALETLILLPFALLLMRRHVQVTTGHIALWGALWLVPAVVFAAWIYMSHQGLLNLPVDLLMIGLTFFSWLITLPFIRKPVAAIGEASVPAEPDPIFEALAAEPEAPAEEVPAPQPVAEEPPAARVEMPAPQPVPEDIPAPQEKKLPAQDQATKKLPSLRTSREPDFGTRMQAQQYDHLMARISQANQFHQELRRHIEAMTYRLERKQYEKLQKHLDSLQQQFASEDQAVFCEHAALDPILAYFCQMGGYSGVKVTTDVNLTGSLPIAASDLTVLFGNLLDNALEACRKQTGSDRRIFTSAWTDARCLYMTVENTYEGTALKDSRSNYISSKQPGCGMGLEVCKAIVSRYRGKLEITDSNGIFKVNITLKY